MNVQLQVLGSALRAVAEEMGAVLVRSAFSANIKERRDCSTALLDADGRMVAQAEHIPVHLGALPEAVAAVRERDPAPGETWILNDPFAGGTHLPDVTLVSRTELGFAATRAHHADVGGVEPGSMPATSTRLEDEGVVIPPTRLDAATLDELVARMRNPDERRGDLRAQLAAQRLAERRVAELCARRGRERVVAAMDELRAYSERRVRAGIGGLPDGRYEAADVLEAPEGELEIRVAVTVSGDELEVDFAGTAAQHGGNLNCPLAVTRSACLYVVRCLTDPDVPASAGALAPVTIRAPLGSLVNARAPAAVAAGNVETSGRIVDCLFLALGQAVAVPAQGQGTMNNLTLGNERFTYYETIGGGQGACPDSDGPSGVHVSMSNTLNTPVEALELAYPLRVERYALRPGSGGAGRRHGGDGVVRELRVLEPCRMSLLTERRSRAPQGAAGGAPGARGRNLLNGEELPAKATRDLAAGDVVTIETPGGGGFGRPPRSAPTNLREAFRITSRSRTRREFAAMDKVLEMRRRGDTDALLSALGDPFPGVRSSAARALGRLEEQRAVAPLSALLANRDEDEDVLISAARALGRIGGADAACGLTAGLDDQSEVVRRWTISALAGLGSTAAVGPLLEYLRSDHWWHRYFAAEWLGRMGDPAAIEPLRAARARERLPRKLRHIRALWRIRRKQRRMAILPP